MARERLEAIQQQLKKVGLSFELVKQEEEESLLFSIEKADCVVELWGNGRLTCQFGVDMEELRTLLAGSATEDIAEDELQRVARDHLRPICQRYRSMLIAQRFEETVETTEQYYAISFLKSVDLQNSSGVMTQLQDCLRLFS